MIGGGLTDDAVLELLVRYWRADRTLDPGSRVSLPERLLAIDPSIEEWPDTGRMRRPRFLLDPDVVDGMTVVRFFQPPDWEGLFAFERADPDSIWETPAGGPWRRSLRVGVRETVAEQLIRYLRVKAPVAGAVRPASPAAIAALTQGLTLVAGGSGLYRTWVGEDVIVDEGHDLCVAGADRAAVERTGANRCEGWQWWHLPRMAEPETDWVVVGHPPARTPDAGATTDFVAALTVRPPETALEEFLLQWTRVPLPAAAPAEGEPALLARLRALDPDVTPYVENEWLLAHGTAAESDPRLLAFRHSFDSAWWAHEPSSGDPEVWYADDSAAQFVPTGVRLSAFLVLDVAAAAVFSAPVMILGHADTEEEARSWLESFTYVGPWRRPGEDHRVYANDNVLVHTHGDVNFAAGAKAREHIAATSLARSGRWHWVYRAA